VSYDEPEILPSSSHPMCLRSADAGHSSLRNPEVPVSWGELIDKITILEIKGIRLPSGCGRANVRRELSLLEEKALPVLNENRPLKELKSKLKSVNEKLWEIEDRIRHKEAIGVFDESFIQLARAVYITNDERSRIKQEINVLSSSELVEEKGYAPY
jgi:hypothetical protein